jgi:hypothetical protein
MRIGLWLLNPPSTKPAIQHIKVVKTGQGISWGGFGSLFCLRGHPARRGLTRWRLDPLVRNVEWADSTGLTLSESCLPPNTPSPPLSLSIHIGFSSWIVWMIVGCIFGELALRANVLIIPLWAPVQPLGNLFSFGKVAAKGTINSFFWLLLLDGLNTRNLLCRKNFYLQSYDCVLCSNNAEETLEHLFFDCTFSARC